MNSSTEATGMLLGQRLPQLRVAVIGLAGSGKSTTATLIEEAVAERGLRCARLKLAAPLYDLQSRIYETAGTPVPPGAQDQVLMEALADALRRIRATSIVEDFLSRMERIETDVVVNDDLRDPYVDAPCLAEKGFRIVRVCTTEEIRQARLEGRADLTRSDCSTRALDTIRPDAVIDNSSGMETLRTAVRSVLGRWL